MIELIRYTSETKNFSIPSIQSVAAIKEVSDYLNNLRFTSKVGKIVLPMILITAYKFEPLPSALSTKVTDEYKKRQLYLIDQLKKKVPELPIIIANRFENACYVGDLDKIVEKYGEDELRKFCKELGADFEEVKSKLGPHMIFMGRKYYAAPILAHEIGHYLNTVGRGEEGGQEAHKVYGKRYKASTIMHNTAVISGTGAELYAYVRGVNKATIGTLFGSSGLFIAAMVVGKPVLVAEKSASLTGLGLLKSIGVTDDEYYEYEDNLRQAYQTYVTVFKTMKITGAITSAANAIIQLLIYKR